MTRAALEQWCVAPADELAAATKAFAGRAGRRVAQRALQVFGAIAFTDEHMHHRYSRRIHTLDALLGDPATLCTQLGGALVRTGRAPRAIEAWRAASDA